MVKKESVELEKLKQLCNFDGEKFVSKSGIDYIHALASIFDLINLNDNPFTSEDIERQPTITDFLFSGVKDFVFICELKAKPMIINKDRRSNEKIEAFNFANEEAEKIFNKSLGVVYILTCIINEKEHIVKIGASRTPFKKRLCSYNCGAAYNWRTASTTNLKILQSFLVTRLTYKLYIYDCNEDVVRYNFHGIESIPFASSKSLAIEDIMVKQYYNQFKTKPLANIQTKATEI